MKKRIIAVAAFVIFVAGPVRAQASELVEAEESPQNLEELCERSDVIGLVSIESASLPAVTMGEKMPGPERRTYSGFVVAGIKGITRDKKISFSEMIGAPGRFADSFNQRLEKDTIYLLFLKRGQKDELEVWPDFWRPARFVFDIAHRAAYMDIERPAIQSVIDVLLRGFLEPNADWRGSLNLLRRSEVFRERLRDEAFTQKCIEMLSEMKAQAGDWSTISRVYESLGIFGQKTDISEITTYILDPSKSVDGRRAALGWLGRYSNQEEIRALRGIVDGCEAREVVERAEERLKSVAGDMSKLSDQMQAAMKVVFDANISADLTSLVELIESLDDRDRREPRKILRGALVDNDAETRIRAATALMGLKDGRGLDALIEEMATDDAGVRIRVARLLAGTDNYEVVPVMRKAMGDESPYIRALAIDFLGRKKDQGAFSEVLGHTEDKEAHGIADANVSASPALAACKALGQLQRMEAAEALMAAVEDEDLSKVACEALEAITGKKYGYNIEDWRAWWAWQNLDSREIVVRVYECGADGLITKHVRKLEEGQIRFDSEKSLASLVAIMAEDQNDVYVRRFLGDVSYAWKGTRLPTSFRLMRNDEAKRAVRTRSVSDALGNPLVGAKITLVTQAPDGRAFEKGEKFTDGEGRFDEFLYEGTADRHYKFEHPDYGIALRATNTSERHTIVPLVADNSEMILRSAWGRVLDNYGQPVAGARISVRGVIVPGSEGMYPSPIAANAAAMTDSQGYFRVCGGLRDGKVLPACYYSVLTSAPKQTGLAKKLESIPSGQSTVITLQESNETFLRFTFVDDEGQVISDAELLSSVTLFHRIGGTTWPVDRSRWIKGGVFEPGTFWATMAWGGHTYGFLPVEATGEGGEEVVLVMKRQMAYYGRIVDGATGGPLSGALVYASSSPCSEVDLASVTDEQWDACARLQPNVVGDEPELEPFKMFYTRILSAGFTDEQGAYNITVDSGASLHAIAFMKKDYLGIGVGPMPYMPPAETEVELPELKLYRAAKAAVEAQYSEDCEVRFSKTLPNNEALEGREPYAVWNIRHETGYTIFNIGPNEFRSNTVQTFHIPANMDMCFSLNMFVGGDLASWRIPGVFRAAPGETIDLGSHIVGPGVNVYVRALDRRGAPLEGLAIKKYRTGFKDSGLIRVTDEEGVARFLVSRFKKGEFGVHYDSEEEGVHLRETVVYEITGEADEGREFVLVLSDEILYHLFK